MRRSRDIGSDIDSGLRRYSLMPPGSQEPPRQSDSSREARRKNPLRGAAGLPSRRSRRDADRLHRLNRTTRPLVSTCHSCDVKRSTCCGRRISHERWKPSECESAASEATLAISNRVALATIGAPRSSFSTAPSQSQNRRVPWRRRPRHAGCPPLFPLVTC